MKPVCRISWEQVEDSLFGNEYLPEVDFQLGLHPFVGMVVPDTCVVTLAIDVKVMMKAIMKSIMKAQGALG